MSIYLVTSLDISDADLASRMPELDLIMTYEAQKVKKRKTKYAKAIAAEMVKRGLKI